MILEAAADVSRTSAEWRFDTSEVDPELLLAAVAVATYLVRGSGDEVSAFWETAEPAVVVIPGPLGELVRSLEGQVM